MRLAERSPLDALAQFADLPDVSLLASTSDDHPLSRFSFLAADPVARVIATAGEWPAARDRVRATLDRAAPRIPGLPPYQGGWIGWLGYELGTAFTRHARHTNEAHPVADIALALHDWVIAWDHREGATWLISTGIDDTGERDEARARARAAEVVARWERAGTIPAAHDGAPDTHAVSDFTEREYRNAVDRVIEYVLAGDIFQANLAQRFSTPFSGDPLSLFRRLTVRAPAPMSAYLSRGGVVVASASPERFIQVDAASGAVETRPIKGTRRRDADPRRDAGLAAELAASIKDRAENVMIVDLMRNDLSRVCVPGSVKVPSLCALESHRTVHHLVSTVTGTLRADHDALDLIAATFPGGSITGAPKLRAMEIIAELEPVARGVYSGAIGWIGLDGSIDMNIAIRTVTVAGGAATFHAGGGITALSVAEDEYQESLDKARALAAALANSA